jgi:tRNA(Leu) C34 or U34 (ribose-2'-O)-methylase TrmL
MDDQAQFLVHSTPSSTMEAMTQQVESMTTETFTNRSNNDTSVSKMYLIVTNISKRTNVRELLQIGVAYGCEKILVVGQKSLNFNVVDNSDGRVSDVQANTTTTTDVPKQLIPAFLSGEISIQRFDKWKDCVIFLKERNVVIVGVEIHQDAKTIQEICQHITNKMFETNHVVDVAFLMGNEGTGLHDKQMQSCDMFCRIPQYGTGTASLNVYVAASIILYHFHNYQRSQFQQLIHCNTGT